ncbi:hypothetical protein P280DRAFT_513771 [Massarina eburnea CBS 473.64]|uniref:Uncharacterized protein n=1 Tax=Massarina eburnea CBS 473.64 TaxID=1395130 RepID=A0A6A6SI28_9PLEO|nr:hypothetical protein P280DRAFT_513771 [Massarina eburnea CBS 473.64]
MAGNNASVTHRPTIVQLLNADADDPAFDTYKDILELILHRAAGEEDWFHIPQRYIDSMPEPFLDSCPTTLVALRSARDGDITTSPIVSYDDEGDADTEWDWDEDDMMEVNTSDTKEKKKGQNTEEDKRIEMTDLDGKADSGGDSVANNTPGLGIGENVQTATCFDCQPSADHLDGRAGRTPPWRKAKTLATDMASSQALPTNSDDKGKDHMFRCSFCTAELPTIPELWDAADPYDAIFEHVRKCSIGKEPRCPLCLMFLPWEGTKPYNISILHVVDGCDDPKHGTAAINRARSRGVQFMKNFSKLWDFPKPRVRLSRLRLWLEKVDILTDCPLCGIYWADATTQERAEHSNDCWGNLAKEFVGRPRRYLEESDRSVTPTIVTSSPPPLPSRLLHEAFVTQPPTSSCLFCRLDLSTRSTTDALHHRVICFRSQPTGNCPICYLELDPFSTLSESGLESSMWHLKICHEGSKADSTDRLEFGNLYLAWSGLMSIPYDFHARVDGTGVNGAESRSRYNRKLQMKRDNGGVYQLGTSRLREVQTADDVQDLDCDPNCDPKCDSDYYSDWVSDWDSDTF